MDGSMTDVAEIVIRQASLSEIIGLRQEAIIAGTDRSTPEFPGDHAEGTRHFGAFAGGQTVGCATFLCSAWEDVPAWHLRGMATRLEYRGQGVGSRLLEFAETTLCREWPIRILWCNARIQAAGFYVKHGWRIVTDEFPIEGVGPHYRMLKDLAVSSGSS